MPSIEYEIDNETPCLYCHSMVPLDQNHCPNCKTELLPRFQLDELVSMFFNQEVVDVRAGGYVIGDHDKEDNIPMIAPAGKGVIQLVGMMQGGEFVINNIASKKYFKRLEEINSYKEGEYSPLKNIPITDTSQIHNANNGDKKKAVYLYLESYVINRLATQKYFEELLEINGA